MVKQKSCAFQGCAEMMLQLHTVRTGIPDTPQTRLSASSFHEYPSDTPQTSPKYPPDISRELKISTDDNR